MGAPEGYVALDLVGFTDKGDYNSTATYMKNDLAHYNNDVWCSLKDNLTGAVPAEGDSWKIFVRGANTAGGTTAIDTSGLLGNAGEVVIAQELLDAISNAVLNKLVAKTMMSGVQIDSADMVPTSALVYAMQEAITKLNSDMGGCLIVLNYTFGSENASETFSYGKTFSTTPIILGVRVGNNNLQTDQYIKGMASFIDGIRIERTSASAYAGNKFFVVLFIPNSQAL